MSNLDEQLALFEREVLSSVTESAPAKNGTTSKTQPSTNGNATARAGTKMAFTGPVIPSVASSQATNSAPPTTTKFVPHQLRVNHPIANFVRAAPMPSSIPSQPVTIESGPTLYNTSTTSKSRKEESTSRSVRDDQGIAMSMPPQPPPLKTMVLRGEKKMKRFVRTGGGQVWEDPSLAEWDPNDFRIFCGDLGNEVSDELLAKAFRKYPSFQKAKVVRDNRTNKSKGYGFVSFKHQDDFVRAMREMDGKYVGNRPIKLRKSSWKERNLDLVRRKHKDKKKLGLV
ncbi:RNA recognition motif domain-containing protein [Ditylenchus destructor]|uniref:RNA-binding protein 42 n=1 Tax=Ditylenchus destructor TaxID=166010 RepID=A0AAD4N650_9BILA|nr:RNA recognition motif domain-containing protein [Ditylenchus destructor]